MGAALIPFCSSSHFSLSLLNYYQFISHSLYFSLTLTILSLCLRCHPTISLFSLPYFALLLSLSVPLSNSYFSLFFSSHHILPPLPLLFSSSFFFFSHSPYRICVAADHSGWRLKRRAPVSFPLCVIHTHLRNRRSLMRWQENEQRRDKMMVRWNRKGKESERRYRKKAA